MPQVASSVSSRRPYRRRTITRSIIEPNSAVTMKASGIAINIPVCSQMPDMHRRVGTNHHHFAVGHVDDAHDAVGDGEAQRHKQQNGTDAEADEQSIDHGITNAAAENVGGRVTGSDQVFLSLAVSSPLEVQNRLSSVSP